MFEIKEKKPRIPRKTPPDPRLAKEVWGSEGVEDEERVNRHNKKKTSTFCVERKLGFSK